MTYYRLLPLRNNRPLFFLKHKHALFKALHHLYPKSDGTYQAQKLISERKTEVQQTVYHLQNDFCLATPIFITFISETCNGKLSAHFPYAIILQKNDIILYTTNHVTYNADHTIDYIVGVFSNTQINLHARVWVLFLIRSMINQRGYCKN